MRKDWSVILFSDLQVHIVVCRSVPHGVEHSFLLVYGCQKHVLRCVIHFFSFRDVRSQVTLQ